MPAVQMIVETHNLTKEPFIGWQLTLLEKQQA